MKFYLLMVVVNKKGLLRVFPSVNQKGLLRGFFCWVKFQVKGVGYYNLIAFDMLNWNNNGLTESNTRKREFLEMIEIQKSKNTINAKTDTKYLSKIYHNII